MDEIDDDNILSFADAQAKTAGVSPEFSELIHKLNNHFNLTISLSDSRLERLKSLYSVLNTAAIEQHDIDIEGFSDEHIELFRSGVKLGRAQMLTDIIVCVLEEDGLLIRKQP